MSKLTTKARNGLVAKDFAIPGARKYPINDRAHAANAKARVSQFGTPAEKAAVDAAVGRRFPNMGKDKELHGKIAAVDKEHGFKRGSLI